jgi:hypothetical protein
MGGVGGWMSGEEIPFVDGKCWARHILLVHRSKDISIGE